MNMLDTDCTDITWRMRANVEKNEQRGNYRKYFVAIILHVQLLSNDKKNYF